MGKLVIVEGPDGSGKSTLIEGLKNYFVNKRLQNLILPENHTVKTRVLVVNFSYPDEGEMFQSAAFARGEYMASIRLFKKLLEADYDIICDRFHLGEYAYGPVKRNYPEFLAEKVFDTVEPELIKEVGLDNILLVILTAVPYVLMKRVDKRKGEYLKTYEEYARINSRYLTCRPKTQLSSISIETTNVTPEEILVAVVKMLKFIEEGED